MIRQNGVAPNLGPSTSRGIPHNIWKILWKINVPQKLKHFLWKACNNILPVRENLVTKKVVPSGLCPLCNQEGESVEHALVFCGWTRPSWFSSQL